MQITIYKHYDNPFNIFSKNGQIYAQWNYTPSTEIEGFGTYYEDSIVPRGDYGDIVNAIIQMRYSDSAEKAILRQRDTKPQEFQEYFEFCEEAKRVAKEINE